MSEKDAQAAVATEKNIPPYRTKDDENEKDEPFGHGIRCEKHERAHDAGYGSQDYVVENQRIKMPGPSREQQAFESRSSKTIPKEQVPGKNLEPLLGKCSRVQMWPTEDARPQGKAADNRMT